MRASTLALCRMGTTSCDALCCSAVFSSCPDSLASESVALPGGGAGGAGMAKSSSSCDEGVGISLPLLIMVERYFDELYAVV